MAPFSLMSVATILRNVFGVSRGSSALGRHAASHVEARLNYGVQQQNVHDLSGQRDEISSAMKSAAR
jgi:hypothetical protein